MTGNELITITIEDRDKRISTRYSLMDADRFNGTKGEYHLLMFDVLVKRFNDSMEKDWQVDVMIEMGKDSDKLESENLIEKINNILCPKPLGEILKEEGITIDEETRQRNFEDGIRYIQG